MSNKMAHAYILSPEARLDYIEIINYIAQDNPYAAKKIKAEFNDAFKKLSHMPHMGHTRQDLTDKPLRFWPVHSYLIVYNPESKPLAIVRVLSGYRDITDLLGD
jgi:plasmid stabilization system protein ParE